MDIIFQGLGWVGAFGLLSGYFMITTKRINSDSTLYKWINLISAIMLALNAYYIQSIPFLIINCFWAIVALVSIFKTQNTPSAST